MCRNPSTKSKENLEQWMFIDLIDPMIIRRNLTNYNNCFAIIIEFDNKDGAYVSIDDFKAKYAHLSWILHTTSSHTATQHKYRVILPLDEPTPYRVWHNYQVRAEMQVYFPGIDPSSFSNFQKIPAYPANKADYQYIVNHGKKFGYAMIRDAVIERVRIAKEAEAEREAKRKSAMQYESINYEAYKAKVDESMDSMIASLPRSSNGNRYTSFCSAIGSMLSAKYPDGNWIYDVDEVKTAISSVYWDDAINKAWKNFSNRRR